MRIGTIALVLALSIGCGGDDGLTAFDGVYSIDTWTENPDDCNSEGASILANQTDMSFFVKDDEFFGVEFISVVQCPTVADCAAEAASDSINLSLISFEEGSDSSGWRGTGAFLGNDGMGSPCNGEVFVNLMTGPADDVVRIEIEHKEVVDFPAEADGNCDTDVVLAQESSFPCTSLEAFEGSFAEAI